MARKGQRFLILVLLLILADTILYSQTPTGRIFGTVTDDQGIPLPGVSIEALSPKLVGRGVAVTDEKGVYRLFALTPGLYTLIFTLPGFKSVKRDGILVDIEKSIKLDVSLAPGTLEEQITVIGQSPLVDVRSTVKGMTLTWQEFETLPKGRDFDSLVSAVPGVQDEPLLSGISVDGASGAENMFYVDGTDITNVYTGVRGENVAFEFVDEVQVKASGYQAEYGGSVGGVIHVITRQGGNAFHGDIIGYYSGSPLNGKERDTLRRGLYDVNLAEYVNYQDLYGKDDLDRLEAGFNLGGYFLKDRLWFYTSFLPVFQSTGRHVVFDPSLVEGRFSRTDTSWNFQTKLTAQPSKILRLGASYIGNFYHYRGELPNRDGTGDPAAPWPDYGFSYPYWSAAGYADIVLGNNLLLSARGGSFYNNKTDQLVQPSSPRYVHGGTGNSVIPDIPLEYIRPRGWSNMPASALNVTEANIAQRSFVGVDLTYFLNFGGEHAWKFGVQWVRTAEDFQDGFKYPNYPLIQLAWNRPLVLLGQDYGQGTYGYYAVFGNEATGPRGLFYKVRADRWSLYLQDSWTIKDRLTLNLGIRTESEYIPPYTADPAFAGMKSVNFPFGEKLAPRLGFIYDFNGDASLKIFGSYGLYYDVMKLYSAAMTFGGFSNSAIFYKLDTYEWDTLGLNSNYPGDVLTTFNFLPLSFDTIDPDLRPMSQREITFGIERKLAENLSVTARLVQKHLRYAIEDVGVVSDGSVAYYMTNPGYGYSRTTADGGKFDPRYPPVPRAKREYWALNLSLEKRFAGSWMGGFSYTWSRLTGNYSGLASSDEYQPTGEGRNSPNVELFFDAWYLAYDRSLNPIDGPLGTDRTHVFKLYGSYAFPFRLTVGTLMQAMSGTPRTEYWNVEGDYMPYNRGNLGRTPFLFYANLYAEYSVRLGRSRLAFNINVDNVFNRGTALLYYPLRTLYNLTVTEDQLLSGDWELETSGYVPNALFNLPAVFYKPLSARLGIRYSFEFPGRSVQN